jgi:hypothetical protein
MGRDKAGRAYGTGQGRAGVWDGTTKAEGKRDGRFFQSTTKNRENNFPLAFWTTTILKNSSIRGLAKFSLISFSASEA